MFKGYILRKNLPDQKLVSAFTDKLFKYLFPLFEEEEVYSINQANREVDLNITLNTLLTTCVSDNSTVIKDILNNFFELLPTTAEKLVTDAQFILDYDPAAKTIEEIILSYPGFYAITIYRMAHILYQQNIPILPRMMSEQAHSKTGIDINAGAKIGSPFFIDHGTGIVVGETAVIGNYVKLYQGVTLGALAVRKKDAVKKRHPTIEDNVVIYAGSTILGGETTVGHDSIIGGNTWITQSVPSFSVVYHTAQTVVKDRRDFNEPINFII